MDLPLIGHVPTALIAVGSLLGAFVMIAWRKHETQRPVSVRSIVVPPLGMSTGFSMFLAPAARVPWAYAAAALALGLVVFSVPLTRTSRLVRSGDAVLIERSRAFLVILLGLVAVRFGLRAWVEQWVSPLQTGALLFLLAFGMVARWRAGMLLAYRRLMAQPATA